MLFCPYLCLPQARANGTAALACECREDHCCPSPTSVPGGNESDDSGSTAQGGDCLCHGAVLLSPPTPPSLDVALAVFLPIGDLRTVARSSVRGGNVGAVEHMVCHFAAATSGRAVRALIESFLL
jgi:hypothetical protein